MAKVIIGIHGLANKPKPAVLKKYWKQSIAEGLQNAKAASSNFNFDMVHWSDYLYRYPLHEDDGYRFDPLYNDEPYLPAKRLKAYKDGWKDDLKRLTGKTVGSGLDWFKQKFGADRTADYVIGSRLKDLDYYYQNRIIRARDGSRKGAMRVLRQELIDVLKKHNGKDIMLISHSMGTIIAYDVLRVIGHKGPKVPVKHFVTIGSPLGLPHVKVKIIEERKQENRPKAAKLRTPTLVTDTWKNYADYLDPIAIDSHLSDDFGLNAGGVSVEDDVVSNDYCGRDGERNHHKSYGYLRTPELSRHIKAFLES